MVVMDQCAGNNAQVVSEMMEPFVISRTLMAEAQDILARTNVWIMQMTVRKMAFCGILNAVRTFTMLVVVFAHQIAPQVWQILEFHVQKIPTVEAQEKFWHAQKTKKKMQDFVTSLASTKLMVLAQFVGATAQ